MIIMVSFTFSSIDCVLIAEFISEDFHSWVISLMPCPAITSTALGINSELYGSLTVIAVGGLSEILEWTSPVNVRMFLGQMKLKLRLHDTSSQTRL